MVEDRVQDVNSVTCDIFQIYFYDNLFNHDENSKIQNRKRLNKKTIETLLNELFILEDQQTNEVTIRQYANEKKITVTWSILSFKKKKPLCWVSFTLGKWKKTLSWPHVPAPEPTITYLLGIANFEQVKSNDNLPQNGKEAKKTQFIINSIRNHILTDKLFYTKNQLFI